MRPVEAEGTSFYEPPTVKPVFECQMTTPEMASPWFRRLGWRLPLAWGAVTPNDLLSVRVASDPTPNSAFATERSVKPWSEWPIYRSVSSWRPRMSAARSHQPNSARNLFAVSSPSNCHYPFRAAPAGISPVSRYRHSEIKSFLARATIPMRLCRLAPCPKRW